MTPAHRVVVLLENDATTRELYRRELARHYAVVTCSTEREALEALHALHADAIVLEPAALTDDTWSFFAAVHRMAGYAEVPIVVCSILDARRRGLEIGADAYLVKPVTPAALAAALAALLTAEPQDVSATGNHA